MTAKKQAIGWAGPLTVLQRASDFNEKNKLGFPGSVFDTLRRDMPTAALKNPLEVIGINVDTGAERGAGFLAQLVVQHFMDTMGQVSQKEGWRRSYSPVIFHLAKLQLSRFTQSAEPQMRWIRFDMGADVGVSPRQLYREQPRRPLPGLDYLLVASQQYSVYPQAMMDRRVPSAYISGLMFDLQSTLKGVLCMSVARGRAEEREIYLDWNMVGGCRSDFAIPKRMKLPPKSRQTPQ